MVNQQVNDFFFLIKKKFSKLCFSKENISFNILQTALNCWAIPEKVFILMPLASVWEEMWQMFSLSFT